MRGTQVWFQNQRQTLKRLRVGAQENANASSSSPALTHLPAEHAQRPTVGYRYATSPLLPFEATPVNHTPPPRPLEPWPPLNAGWSLPSPTPQQPLYQYASGSNAYDANSSHDTGLRGFTLPPLSMILGAPVPSHLANSPHPHTSRSTSHSSTSSSSGFSRSDAIVTATPALHGTMNLATTMPGTLGSNRPVFEYFPLEQRLFGDAYPRSDRPAHPRMHEAPLPLGPPSHPQEHWNFGLMESTFDTPVGDSWKYPAVPQANRGWNDDQDWRSRGSL